MPGRAEGQALWFFRRRVVFPSVPTKTQKLILESRSELRIETHVHFTDKSGRPDYNSVEYFKRK